MFPPLAFHPQVAHTKSQPAPLKTELEERGKALQLEADLLRLRAELAAMSAARKAADEQVRRIAVHESTLIALHCSP